MPTSSDDIAAERSGSGWVWIFQSPGGGFYRGGKRYKTKQHAIKAGEEWVAEWRRIED